MITANSSTSSAVPRHTAVVRGAVDRAVTSFRSLRPTSDQIWRNHDRRHLSQRGRPHGRPGPTCRGGHWPSPVTASPCGDDATVTADWPRHRSRRPRRPAAAAEASSTPTTTCGSARTWRARAAHRGGNPRRGLPPADRLDHGQSSASWIGRKPGLARSPRARCHDTDLDAITGDKPAFVLTYDVHTAWLNTAACGSSASTRDHTELPFGTATGS